MLRLFGLKGQLLTLIAFLLSSRLLSLQGTSTNLASARTDETSRLPRPPSFFSHPDPTLPSPSTSNPRPSFDLTILLPFPPSSNFGPIQNSLAKMVSSDLHKALSAVHAHQGTCAE